MQFINKTCVLNSNSPFNDKQKTNFEYIQYFDRLVACLNFIDYNLLNGIYAKEISAFYLCKFS